MTTESFDRIEAARERGRVAAASYVAGIRAYLQGWPRDFIDHPDYRRGWDAMAARLERI